MSAAFLLLALAVAAVFVFLLTRPLLRGNVAPAGPADDGGVRTILAERLAAIDADRAAGLLSAEAAEEAALEAKRAALTSGTLVSGTLASEGPSASTVAGESKAWRLAAIATVGLAPVLAGAIYLDVGAPGYEFAAVQQDAPASVGAASAEDSGGDSPAADIAALPPEERAAMIEGMVDGLASRLEAEPDDLRGWRMLARSQGVLGRHEAAAGSYLKAIELAEKTEAGATPDDWRGFAAARAAAAPEGAFPADADFLRALDAIEKTRPNDPFAVFYRGGVARETGEAARAAEIWRGLLAALPDDAPVRGVLEGLISEAEAAADHAAGASDG